MQKKSIDSITTDDYYIDFAIPDLGAFTLLNSKPENITTPGNTKELAASLLNVVSGGTHISPGLAIDWAPVRTFWKSTTPQDYKNSHLWRNLQITLGTISDSIGTKVGAGVKWTFVDNSDPLLDEQYEAKLLNLRASAFTDLPKAKNSFSMQLDLFMQKIQIARKIPESRGNLFSIQSIKLLFDFDPKDSTLFKKELMVFYSMAIDTINTELKKYLKTQMIP